MQRDINNNANNATEHICVECTENIRVSIPGTSFGTIPALFQSIGPHNGWQ